MLERFTYLSLQELPILDDGNGHDFFCAIRIIVDSNTSDYHKKFPQSARTRSVKPYISKIKGFDKGTAKWNEVFLFEIPEKVTNIKHHICMCTLTFLKFKCHHLKKHMIMTLGPF